MIVRREVGRSDAEESRVWMRNKCAGETLETKEK